MDSRDYRPRAVGDYWFYNLPYKGVAIPLGAVAVASGYGIKVYWERRDWFRLFICSLLFGGSAFLSIQAFRNRDYFGGY